MRPNTVLPIAVALAALAGAACGFGTEPGLPAGDVSIVLNASTKGSAAFSPSPFSESFATRAVVIWVNADRTTGAYGGTTGTAHHLISDTGLFDSGTISPEATFTFTFAASGTYQYHCTIHPSMVGTITITP